MFKYLFEFPFSQQVTANCREVYFAFDVSVVFDFVHWFASLIRAVYN